MDSNVGAGNAAGLNSLFIDDLPPAASHPMLVYITMKLTIATCQFPISADLGRNLDYVRRQMRAARQRGADVAHFPESALAGYAGVDRPSHDDLDWSALREGHEAVARAARDLKLWVVFGSTHRLSKGRKPHNSLYIIGARGRLVDRYDKRFCTGTRGGQGGDLRHYSPGDHAAVFSINGVRCGALICHDFRYDELYRDYKRRKVQLIFHSYHNGRKDPQRIAGDKNIMGAAVPAAMATYAANNALWISASNTSARASCWAAFFTHPDGAIAGRLRRNVAGVLINTIDTEQTFYDASGPWRDRAVEGILHSGNTVTDPRSDDRRNF